MPFTIEIITDTAILRRAYDAPVRLSQVLIDAGLSHAQPCGGHGRCGKCIVRATGELSPIGPTEAAALAQLPDVDDATRLGCQALAIGQAILYYNTSDAAVQGVTQGFQRKILIAPPRPAASNARDLGMAVDIGTTTVAAYLYDRASGALLAQGCVENPQKAHGADVISRIEFAMGGGARTLQEEMETCLAALERQLCAAAGVTDPICARVIVGNTAMLHLVTKTDPSPLAAAPFEVKRTFGEWEEDRYYPRCMSAYVGADMTAAILASGMMEKRERALLLDVGTNGEMALLDGAKLRCCSTAAGPAFEGAGISCGSMAIPGAISRVWAENGALAYETIDNAKAVGLCGTGLIDAVATLLALGVLEDSGYMEDDAPLGDSGLYLTRRDIRQLQLAKAAIRAGIDTLLAAAGMDYGQIDTVYLAGGFGSYLHPESCAAIGMIPRELVGKLKVLGNAAGQGASRILLSRGELERAEQIAAEAEVIELSQRADFMERYVGEMMF